MALGGLWNDPAITIIPVSLWSITASDFWEWAQQFCERVAAEGATHNVILGYSLGGRLALHAVLSKPELWQGAIATSASPGIPNIQDRRACLQRDQGWGQRFLTEPWQALLTDWDRLPVFNDIPCPLHREEHHFSRPQIARFFDVYSQGRQEDLLPQLKGLTMPPILYVSGQLDAKYGEIGRRLARDCSVVEWVEIANAGHRVPWENPQPFTQTVQRFLRQW